MKRSSSPSTVSTSRFASWAGEIRSTGGLLLLLFSIRSVLADWNPVPTGSMKPTVLEGDVVWVNKLAYDLKVPFTTLHLAEWANPERGDIVVFFEPIHEQRYVKRIVGLPGDVIELNDNQLTLNGRPVEMKPIGSQMSEGSVRSEEILGGHRHAMALLPGKPAMRSFAPLTVPAGHYFVMGDNRDNSLDSRFIGTIERRRIIGRASGILASADPEHYYRPRLERWCTRLQ